MVRRFARPSMALCLAVWSLGGCQLLAGISVIDSTAEADGGDAAQDGAADALTEADATDATMRVDAADATTPQDADRVDATDAAADVPDACAADAAGLQQDPLNCGACGHDCLGGTCVGGACAPFVIATNQLGTYWLAIDPPTLYWTDGSSVHGCPTTGCADAGPSSVVTLDGGSIQELAAGGGEVLFSTCPPDGGGGVLGCPESGCSGTPEARAAGYGCIRALGVDTVTSVFYFGNGSDGTYRCPLAGCGSGASFLDSTLGYHGGYLASVALSGPNVFFLGANGDIAECVNDYCTPPGFESLAAVGGITGIPASIAGGFLYWAFYGDGPDQAFSPLNIPLITNSGGGVRRLALPWDGGAAEVLVGAGSPTAVVATGTAFYFTDFGSGSILECPASGCGAAPSVLAIGQEQPFALVQDSTAIYWANYGDGRIMKLAK